MTAHDRGTSGPLVSSMRRCPRKPDAPSCVRFASTVSLHRRCCLLRSTPLLVPRYPLPAKRWRMSKRTSKPLLLRSRKPTGRSNPPSAALNGSNSPRSARIPDSVPGFVNSSPGSTCRSSRSTTVWPEKSPPSSGTSSFFRIASTPFAGRGGSSTTGTATQSSRLRPAASERVMTP